MQGFSVRWTGTIIRAIDGYVPSSSWPPTPPRGCIINDKLILDSKSKVRREGSVALMMDKRYDIRVDYYAGATAATCCKLFWSTPSQPEAQVIPSEYFHYTPPLRAAAPPAASARPKPYTAAKGVLLTDGSFITGSDLRADDQSVTFAQHGKQSVTIPLGQVARVVFHPLPDSADAKIAGKGPGLFTLGGDFIEGECQEIQGGNMKLNSVVFGPSTIDIASRAAAVVYHDAGLTDAPWTIRTISGGVIRAASYRVEGDSVLVDEPAAGRLEFQLHEIVEIASDK